MKHYWTHFKEDKSQTIICSDLDCRCKCPHSDRNNPNAKGVRIVSWECFKDCRKLQKSVKMLTFKINDKQGVELTFDGEDRRLAELNAGNGATAQDVALGAVVVQALKLMNYKPRMELVNNLIKAKERKDK